MENSPQQVTVGISVGAAHRRPSRAPKSYAGILPLLPHLLYVKNKKFYLTLHPMGQNGGQQEHVEENLQMRRERALCSYPDEPLFPVHGRPGVYP